MLSMLRTPSDSATPAAGETSHVLAHEYGVSDTAMLRRIRARGVPTRGTGGRLHDEATRARAGAMYLAGASAREVGATFDTAKPVVLGWVRAAGGEVRSNHRVPR